MTQECLYRVFYIFLLYKYKITIQTSLHYRSLFIIRLEYSKKKNRKKTTINADLKEMHYMYDENNVVDRLHLLQARYVVVYISRQHWVG